KDHARAPEKLAHREPLVPMKNWLELSELPTIRSLVPLLKRHDVLLRKTEVPPSKLKFRLPESLSMLRLLEIVIEPRLRLYVNPCLPLWNAMLRRTMWFTPMSSPPSLKPLRSPLPAWPPLLSVPLLYDSESSIVTGPIGPVSVLVNRSQPSSMLLWDTANRKTLPDPIVSFAAKPSASSPSESALSCDSALSTRLLAGHWLCGVLSEIRDSCNPLRRVKRVTVR